MDDRAGRGLSVAPRPVSLRRARLEATGTNIRAKIGARLAKLAGFIAQGKIDTRAVVVVMLDVDGRPDVEMMGSMRWKEVWEAFSIIKQVGHRAEHDQSVVDNFTEHLSEEWDKRRWLEEHHAQQRREAEAPYKWQCEHCPKKYRTERGAKQHEARCWRNPGARQYGPDGDSEPVIEGGKITGHFQRGTRARLRP